MESLFKQKLLGLRKPRNPRTFGEALLGETEWLKMGHSQSTKLPAKEVFSEKMQVIESLERFAHEKIAEKNSNMLKFDGGEVHVKTGLEFEEIYPSSSQESLKAQLSLEPRLLNLVLSDKEPGKIKILFVSEKFRTWDDLSPDLRSGFINELIAGFPIKTAELFERMIGAMKLVPSEVIIYPVEGSDETDYSAQVMSIAAFYRPEVIVTLGAKATHKILKSNDRLTLIHGQFFVRQFPGGESFHITPLFHPSIIETNQNMKKTAWADMQKIMKHLKKIT